MTKIGINKNPKMIASALINYKAIYKDIFPQKVLTKNVHFYIDKCKMITKLKQGNKCKIIKYNKINRR